jgi:predicted transcriptional regulator
MDDRGRAKKYTPLITREEASVEETHKLLIHVFSGKASLLVNQLVDSGDLSAKDLQEILKAMLEIGK